MKLMVIDGNSIVNRAYYGIRPLSTRDGLYTHAIYGFLTTLQRLLDVSSRRRCASPSTAGSLPSAIRRMNVTRPSAKGCRRSWPCSCRI